MTRSLTKFSQKPGLKDYANKSFLESLRESEISEKIVGQANLDGGPKAKDHVFRPVLTEEER